MHPSYNHSITGGTLGGTLLTVIINIQYTDIIKTALLAAIGAIVSFGVSYGCKMLLKRYRRK